ncbi:TadE/TadG family type IV pilus assembly protein [Roseibium sp.]|uniref:TadE/TadG family type IV pilus assembly protein n=1 Tax=Roseibium sp. TaxID=1936156 RepID=UPI003D0A32F4
MTFKFTRRFARDEDASMSIETLFAIPLLVWAITATFVFWDAFKTLTISQKATYTVADMLSRETNAIDGNYLTSMHEVFDFLAGDAGDNAIRVTVVTKTVNEDTQAEELKLVWSQGSDVSAYTDLASIQDRLPTIAVGEQMIVVESEQEWSPGFDVGLGTYRFRKVAIARPRFSPQLVWNNA